MRGDLSWAQDPISSLKWSWVPTFLSLKLPHFCQGAGGCSVSYTKPNYACKKCSKGTLSNLARLQTPHVVTFFDFTSFDTVPTFLAHKTSNLTLGSRNGERRLFQHPVVNRLASATKMQQCSGPGCPAIARALLTLRDLLLT